MTDLAVSTQLKQWTFEKPALVRPERSDSSASSPDMYNNDSETLRIGAAAVAEPQDLDSKESLSLHERYLSSEEDLSPMEGNSDSDSDDDDVSIHEPEKEYFHARKMSISRFDKGKSCDMAVIVSFVSAGRPKMIDLPNQGSPPLCEPTQRPQRSASLAGLPIAVIQKLREIEQSPRLSLAVSPTSPSLSTTRSPSPAISLQSRRQTPSPAPSSLKNSSLHSSDSSFTENCTRSSSPWAREKTTRSFTGQPTSSSPWANTRRPATAAATQPARSSLYVTSTLPFKSQSQPSAPLTPLSPELHSFLSSDPYETSTVSSASPIIKSSPHKRLRSISQKLSLAKIAISSPSTKKWDSRVNGKGANSPQLPMTPYTPVTPQTAPPITFAPATNKLRRNSRISRPTSRIGLTPDLPTPTSSMLETQTRTRMQRMVPRGANEREPMLELPPFPVEDLDNPAMSLKARRIRKRKSLMDLL